MTVNAHTHPASRLLLTVALTLGVAASSTASAGAKVVISDGHVDAASARIVKGELRTYVKDASKGEVVWRDPSRVTMRVVDRAKLKLPSGNGFIGPAGQTVWMIPQAQKPGVIWVGWNTEKITRRQIRGGITWRVRSISGPGRLVVFQTGSFGDERILFSSARRMPQSLTIPVGTHAHGNWAFTRRGTYRMRLTMSVRTRSGRRLSDHGTLTFQVG